MKHKVAAVVLAAVAVFFTCNAFCQDEPQVAAPQEQAAQVPAPTPAPAADDAHAKVISVATEAVKTAGYKIEDVNIVYDEGGKLWSEKAGKITPETGSNQGSLKHGETTNDEIVYFDYKEPISDVWVFINKDTGEVVEVYKE